MFVSANTYDITKNKWVNQHIHKIHNQTQYASKHYVNYANDIIFKTKYPTNQRKYRKKLENYFKRQTIYKQTAFDYDDFMFQNKSENYKRIQIRPTIHYNHVDECNIADICYQFYDKYYSNPFDPIHETKYIKNKNKNKNKDTTAHTKTDTNKNKNININKKAVTSYQEWKKETKKIDPEICPQCNTKYGLDNKCSYCANQRWLQSLFEGIKVDIKKQYWHIGTIIKVIKKTQKNLNSQLYLLVRYNGFKSIDDEWIKFNFGGTTPMDKYKVIKLNKIKKLHTITAYHEYECNKYNDSDRYRGDSNSNICTTRKYRKCVLCDVKYCKKCMNVNINKYNQCNKCLKLITKNKWLKDIKPNDKIDVYLYGYRGAQYNSKWYCGWHIATVIQVKKQEDLSENKFKVFVQFDGLESTYAEWIDVNISSKLMGNKLKKLNKMTLIHNYLLNDNIYIPVCVEKNKWKKCILCHHKYCLACVVGGIIIDGIGYECFKCGIRKEKKDLLNIIKQSLFGTGTLMHMKVIYCIYEYSQGITIQCCNQIKHCVNEINFDTKYEMEVNVQQNIKKSVEIYQYYVHKHQTSNVTPNVTIYNKKRRIFCVPCSKNELIKCILCKKSKEVRSAFRHGYNTYKCKPCIESIINKQRKKNELKIMDEETKMDSLDDVNVVNKMNKMNKYVDDYFKKFKDFVVPEIVLKKSKTKQNIKYVDKVLGKYGINVSELPYRIWSMECKLIPNCYRKYCAFYHNDEEKEFGRILSILSEKIKFEKRIVTDKSRHYQRRFNEDLMDYDFNLKYLLLKMTKRQNNNIRKYNVKRKTKKKLKRKAYFLRKKDKKCNAKQNKKFKTRYCLQD